MIFFLQYQKGELSREEATDKIIHCALKSRRWFKQDDGDDQQADMHNLRTIAERKQRDLHLLLITNKRLKRRTRIGVKTEKGAKLGKQKVKKKKKIKYKLWHHQAVAILTKF